MDVVSCNAMLDGMGKMGNVSLLSNFLGVRPDAPVLVSVLLTWVWSRKGNGYILMYFMIRYIICLVLLDQQLLTCMRSQIENAWCM